MRKVLIHSPGNDEREGTEVLFFGENMGVENEEKPLRKEGQKGRCQ